MSHVPESSPLPFQKLNLPEQIQLALRAMKFVEPTPIQAAAIPIARKGRDLIGCAQTGTGKTAAFCIPIIAKLIEDPKATAVVLAPTRELAVQIIDVIKQLTLKTPHIHSALIIGGTSMGSQFRDLARRPQVIVATPGRLADHLRRKSVNFSTVKIVVLDEGDRMLDMGFERQITAILDFVPKDRQMLLFSATMPERVRKLAKKYLREPERISVGVESQPVDKITHSIVSTTRESKKDILLDQLNARTGSVLIFVNTKHGTDRLSSYLSDYGYQVSRIHGGRSQGQRNQALQGFRSKKFRILVATDVAARGLDVPHIEHVINFDLPKDCDDYVHRIGRTARAGAAGEAICLVSAEERSQWNKISKIYKLGHLFGSPPPPSDKNARGGSKNNQKNGRPTQHSGRKQRWHGKRDRQNSRTQTA